jgi:hypothetical protein
MPANGPAQRAAGDNPASQADGERKAMRRPRFKIIADGYTTSEPGCELSEAARRIATEHLAGAKKIEARVVKRSGVGWRLLTEPETKALASAAADEIRRRER